MYRLNELKRHLVQGKVYRRNELEHLTKSVDRHLDELVEGGTLQKLSQGLYHFPAESAYGKLPPDEKELVRVFLKDDRFLLTSSNSYNGLGVGTTQLYNKRIVYNHKRHGEFKLGKRVFDFRMKPHFPRKATPEFLLVDLVNNLDALAEDTDEVLKNVFVRAQSMDIKKLRHAVREYGQMKTKRLFAPIVQ